LSQAEINTLLVSKAKEGKIVVRLKGGDPFVFGRGGEEALALQQNGIPFEIVPGVTAAVAAAAYAGIPVTHRGVSAALTIVTGHEAPAKESKDVDWRALAAVSGTIAVYMGMENLRQLTCELIVGGRAASTPAAVISWGTTPRQRCVAGTLEMIAQLAREAGLAAPAIVIIGDTVSLRERLNWFERLPLFGRRIVCTRPRRQSNKLEASLRRLGADVLPLPTITIEPVKNMERVDAAIQKLSSFDWIIFTSVNGVEIFFDRLLKSGCDARSMAGCAIAAIGPPPLKPLPPVPCTSTASPTVI